MQYLREKKRKRFFLALTYASMANNELSGPALITKVAEYIKTLKNREFTYRLVILPETIGSICYINKFKTNLKKYLYLDLICRA